MSEPSIAELLDGYRERSTRLVKEMARRQPIPRVKVVNETYRFTIGQRVRSTGTGGLIAGVEFTVTDRRKQPSGWCRYYGAGMWHRQYDIEPVD